MTAINVVREHEQRRGTTSARNLQPGRSILLGNVLDRLQKGTIFLSG